MLYNINDTAIESFRFTLAIDRNYTFLKQCYILLLA